MTLEQAREVAMLILVHDRAVEWRETFEENTNHPIVSFSEIRMMDDLVEETNADSFEGDLRMPREIALDMMRWLEATMKARLQKLGVEA